MKLFSFLDTNEKKIIESYIPILKVAKKANSMIPELISNFNILVNIHNLEKRADTISFEIKNEITKGAIAPNLIDDLLELVDKEDDIVDSIYNLAREIVRYKIKRDYTRNFVNKKVEEISTLANLALDELIKMHKESDIENMKRIRKKIQELEQKGDYIKDFLLDYSYNNARTFKSFYHMNELAHKGDDVLDACEDSSDLLLASINSIIT